MPCKQVCWKAAWQLLDEKEYLKRKAQLVTSDTGTESSAGKAEVVLEEETPSRLQHTTSVFPNKRSSSLPHLETLHYSCTNPRTGSTRVVF